MPTNSAVVAIFLVSVAVFILNKGRGRLAGRSRKRMRICWPKPRPFAHSHSIGASLCFQRLAGDGCPWRFSVNLARGRGVIRHRRLCCCSE
jgi:hypothetical protein